MPGSESGGEYACRTPELYAGIGPDRVPDIPTTGTTAAPGAFHLRTGGMIIAMRALLQRVTSARVTVGGDVVGEIDPAAAGAAHGLLALVGVTHTDTTATARAMAEKIWRLRILDGERSAADLRAPVLVVSQFTLYADTRKGRRPSWSGAAPGAVAEPLVETVTEALRELGAEVAGGRFGAHMRVDLTNDGPVTILLEL